MTEDLYLMMKTMFKKAVISTLLSSIFLTTSAIETNASATSGYDGVNMYSFDSIYCLYGNRAGATYVHNLNNELNYNGKTTNIFLNKDGLAREKDFVTTAQGGNGKINSVNFFAWAGHALKYDYYDELGDQSSIHVFVGDGGTVGHDLEGGDQWNATWDEVRLGTGGTLNWATFYTCNWLTNGGVSTRQTKIMNTLAGAHLTMAFASKMYLDSREGTMYGTNLGQGQTFKTAFFNAAQYYQPQLSTDVIARVAGATASGNDSFSSYSADPVPYTSSPSSYSTWTITIPSTGTSSTSAG